MRMGIVFRDVLKSLEDTQAVAENGGYSYILTFVGPDGKEDTIYSSTSVGEYDKLTGEYEKAYGPLNETSRSTSRWAWISDPWPWETEANE